MSKFGIDLEEMAKAGVQFGHKPSKLHPGMKEFIFRLKGTVHLIDLEKTQEYLEGALEYIKEVASKDGVILFVGTKIQHKTMVKELAEKYEMPYVNERWLGGLMTNFGVMRKRAQRFTQLKEEADSEKMEKYSKKEQSKMRHKLGKMELKFGGIEDLKGKPEAVFICDLRKDDLALRESKRKDIKVIAVTDTNVDPSQVDYPIPANDDSISSMKYILGKVDEVLSSVDKKK